MFVWPSWLAQHNNISSTNCIAPFSFITLLKVHLLSSYRYIQLWQPSTNMSGFAHGLSWSQKDNAKKRKVTSKKTNQNVELNLPVVFTSAKDSALTCQQRLQESLVAVFPGPAWHSTRWCSSVQSRCSSHSTPSTWVPCRRGSSCTFVTPHMPCVKSAVQTWRKSRLKVSKMERPVQMCKSSRCEFVFLGSICFGFTIKESTIMKRIKQCLTRS